MWAASPGAPPAPTPAASSAGSARTSSSTSHEMSANPPRASYTLFTITSIQICRKVYFIVAQVTMLEQSKHRRLRRSRGVEFVTQRTCVCTRRIRNVEWCGEGSGAAYKRSPSAPARWQRVGRARAPYPIGGGRGAPANGGEARRGAAAAPAPPHPAAQPLSAICPVPASIAPVGTVTASSQFFANSWG